MMDKTDKWIKVLLFIITIVFIIYIIVFIKNTIVLSNYYKVQYIATCDSLKASSTIIDDSLMTQYFNNKVNDSIIASSINKKDSLLSCYLAKIDTLTHDAISKVDNYIATMDLTIDKANNWIGFWVGLLSALLTIGTILQVWRNYQAKKDFEITKKDIIKNLEKEQNTIFESIDNKQQLLEENNKKLSEQVRITLYESHINSIANCLSSCPNSNIFTQPQERRNYTTFYLKFLCSEFNNYVNNIERVIKDNELVYEDYLTFINRIIYILHTISINITRIQVLFTNINKSTEFYLLSKSLMDCSNNLMSRKFSKEELIVSLRKIQSDFEQLINIL